MTDFATLKSDINAWMVRSFTDAQLESIILLAETRVYRELRSFHMVSQDTLTFSTQSVDLPARFRGALALVPQAGGKWDYMHPARLRESAGYQDYTWTAGGDAAWSIEDGQIIVAPAPSGSPVADIIFWQAPPPLDDTNTTHETLAANYDIFLDACLAVGYDRIEDLEQEAKYMAKVDKNIAKANRESRAILRGTASGHRQTGAFTP